MFAVEFGGVPLTPTFRYEVSEEFGASSDTPDNSHGWYEFAGYLYIEVIAPTKSGSEAFTVFYIRTPTVMSTVNDTFDFPAEWESAIVEYAVSKAYESQRDNVLAAEHMARYEALRQNAWLINKNILMGDAA